MRLRLTPKSLASRLILLVGLMATGLLVSTLVSAVILATTGFALNATSLRWMQLLQAAAVFLLPAILMARFASPATSGSLGATPPPSLGEHIHPAMRYLHADVRPTWRQAGLTVLSMILLIVPMNAIIEWNEAMHLPAWLGGLEAWMAEREATANALIDTMLADATPLGIAANILIMGVMAALSEEFFFRGLLQRMLYDRWRNGVWAVMVAAVLFSAVHLQFYGFVPRLLLGAYFGWLLVATRCIWIPVVAHFTNNLLALLQYYLEHNPATAPGLDNIDAALHTPGLAYIVYAVSLAAFGWTVTQIRR